MADAADLGVARSCQQLEVPLITARCVQHDLHQARCGCGTVHVAGRPAGVAGSAVSIGPNVRALAVYLVVYQHVPIERSPQLIAEPAHAGIVRRVRGRARVRRRGGLRPVRELLSPPLGAHRRQPGVPGPQTRTQRHGRPARRHDGRAVAPASAGTGPAPTTIDSLRAEFREAIQADLDCTHQAQLRARYPLPQTTTPPTDLGKRVPLSGRTPVRGMTARSRASRS